MTSNFRALALVSTLMLAACGGGGGGGSGAPAPAPAGPQAVAITETNAKPVAASALDATQNTSATGGGALPVGVQVDASAPTVLQLITQSVRSAAGSYAVAALPAAVAINQTVSCTYSGTVTISGNVASSSGLSAGDTLTLAMNNCSDSPGTSLSGQLSMTVQSGSLTSVPFHIVIRTTATNLTVVAGGTTVVANGSVTLDWTGSATSETLVASGDAMTSRQTVSGVSHTTTMRNFKQTQTITGTTLTGSLTATIETDSARLGGTTVSYTITTPTPLVWNEATGTATAGVIKVVGASNSQLVLTVNADSSVTIQVDANGDGTFEKTITSTTAELAGLK